jgi:hypothetical protein
MKLPQSITSSIQAAGASANKPAVKRAQYIEIFNRAAESVLEDHEAEWTWLLANVLNLPPCYSTAVYEVLKQGRWRDAKYPKAYIKTAATREALKADKPSSREITLTPTRVSIGHLDKGASRDDKDDANPNEGGITYYKRGGMRVIDNGGEWVGPTDSEGRELPTFNGKAVPVYLCTLQDDEPDARLVIDMAKVWRRIGADEFEQKVFLLRAKQLTAREIFDSATSDRERQELEAAYRRLDRLKPLIREALEASE